MVATDKRVVEELARDNPGLVDTLILKDRGFDFGDYIWDRNGLTEGINDVQYDKGFVWDQDLSLTGSDTNTYPKKVRFT